MHSWGAFRRSWARGYDVRNWGMNGLLADTAEPTRMTLADDSAAASCHSRPHCFGSVPQTGSYSCCRAVLGGTVRLISQERKPQGKLCSPARAPCPPADRDALAYRIFSRRTLVSS